MFLKITMFSDKNSTEVHTIVLLTHISSRWNFQKKKPFGTFLNKIQNIFAIKHR